METLVLKGREALEKGAEYIADGQVVAFPTETVYGLGADAFNEDAVKKIFEAKGRPSDNPLIVHIADKDGLNGLVREIPDGAKAVMDRFMPGPITVIMKKGEKVPESVTAGLDTVGIRMPSHKVARAFIRECGTPIAAPSANRSTHISPTSAQHVFEDMEGRIPLIIDGGDCEVGIESTIIDMSTDVPTILRPGAITAQMLAEVLGAVKTFSGKVVVAKAPGMKYKHYAPVVPCIGARTPEAAVRIASRYPSAVVMGESEFVKAVGGVPVIDLGSTPAECMRNVFSEMRDAEKIYSCIVLEDFSDKPEYYALNNRLSKSTGGRTEE